MRCLEGHPRLLHVSQHRSFFFARSRRLGFACFDRGLHAQVHRPFERSGEASGIDRRSCRVIALCGLIGGPDADDDLNVLRQQHPAWWLCYGRGKHSGKLLAELAGRLCDAGRMDLEPLPDVVQEVGRLRHRVISGRTDLTLGL